MRLHLLPRIGSVVLVIGLLSAGSAVFAQGSSSPSPSGPAPSTSASTTSSGVGPSATDPVATINTLLDVVIGRRFDQVRSFACADSQETLDSHLNYAAVLAASLPPGSDIPGLIATLTFTIPNRLVTLVSNDGSHAVVDVKGALTAGVDQVALRPWVVNALETAGEDSSDAAVDATIRGFVASVGASGDISRQVHVVHEGGVWVVCDLNPTPSPS